MSAILPNGDTPWLLRKAINQLYQLVLTNTNNIALLLTRSSATLYSPTLYVGTGDPNGVVTAPQGSIYTDITTPSAPVQYVKGTSSGNTGWV